MLNLKLGIIDYRMGNLTSVVNAVESFGIKPIIVSDPAQLKECSHIILPGVGSFTKGMERLHEFGFVKALKEECLLEQKPLLGICLGMRLLADRGLEGGTTEGLGFIPGVVRKMECGDFRLPHIGWNNVELKKVHPLLPFVNTEQPDFYFVHSYVIECANGDDILGTCDYGEVFPAVIGRNNIFGVQFHPEKSQKTGLKLLKAFFQLFFQLGASQIQTSLSEVSTRT